MEEKFMRVLVMFDMPTKTKEDRKASTKFRSTLLKEGFLCFNFQFMSGYAKELKVRIPILSDLTYIYPKKDILGL